MKSIRIISLVLAFVLAATLVPIGTGAAVSATEDVPVTRTGLITENAGQPTGGTGKYEGPGPDPEYYYDPVSGEEKPRYDYYNFFSTTTELQSYWYIVSIDLTIDSRITVKGDAKLIIKDGVKLEAKKGINVAKGNSLTIYGQIGGTGQLIATASTKEAGIGGGNHESCGTVVINGGVITAKGGKYGAGIGGGNCGNGGSVTINHGTVKATGGMEGAGIGGGDENHGENVLITGGTVTATGGEWAAGIGGGGVHGADPGDSISSGNHGGRGGNVTIKGGVVTAIGGDRAAGIGGGNHADCGAVTIEDGTVTAYCNGKWGAGIGGGNCGSGGDVVITGGSVEVTAGTSTGSEKPMAIGRGDEGSSYGSIRICRGIRVSVDGTVVDVNNRLGSCLTVGNKTVRIEYCREHQHGEKRCEYCGMVKPVIPLDSTLKKGFNTSGAATVYYAGSPWRVIGFDGEGAAGKAGAVTLIAEENMAYSVFGQTNNEYSSSVLKTRTDVIASSLSSIERTAVYEKTLVSGTYNDYNTDCIAGPEVKNAVMWPLSTKEACDVDNGLCVISTEHPDWATSYWWLRSPGSDRIAAMAVAGFGYTTLSAIHVEYGVRPAFDLDQSYILFASAAEGGKAGGAGIFSKIEENKSNEWKLTVYDRDRADFIANVKNYTGLVFTIEYSDAKTGDNEYISAIIVSKYGKIKYYGKLCAAEEGEDRTVTVNVNVKLRDGDILYIFNEQCNGDKNTDYSSALFKVAGFAVNEPLYGDCNGDGTVNGQDLVRLRKYLNGVPDTDLSEGADVTGDKNVNGQDLVRLRKYLSSEDPSILGPQ